MHQYLVFKSDRFFNKQTSRGLYNIQDLTEIKIPVEMPGIDDWKDYTNITGEVHFADAAYNYVKMKLTHNAIYLLCVPNYETTRLCGQNIIHAENMKDIPVPKKDHVPYNKISVVSQFNFVFDRFDFEVPMQNRCVTLAEPIGSRSECNLDIPQPPPKSHLSFLS